MINIKSYAKINISLNVVGKTDKNYHLLDSIVLPVELHDSILINEIKNGFETYVTIDDFSQGSIEYNIASMAIDRMAKKYGFDKKFRVFIHKVIPMQAGLGGGSSNAAFVMKGVRKLLKLPVSDDELAEIAKGLGADVPFFVKCVPSRMRGIGENLEPITIKNDYYVLIVKPTEGLSTQTVFNKADTMELKTTNIDDVVKALEEGDDDLLERSMCNSLQEPAIELLPEIAKIIEVLKGFGLKLTIMTGSGSAVIALSRDKKLLKKIERKLEDTYTVELTRIIRNAK